MSSSTIRAMVVAVLVVAGLTLVRLKPWQHSTQIASASGAGASVLPTSDDGREKLTVGFLPVT